MKINLELDENNVIIQWRSFPLDEETAIEVEDPYLIHLGIDKCVNGKIIHQNKKYQKALEMQEKHSKIELFKKKLADSDYKIFKYFEGELSEEEYKSIKAERQSWREQINQLEEELK